MLLADDKSTAGSFGGYIRVVALFSLPKKRVWDLVTQPSLQILFMPHLVSSAIVSRTPEGETTDFVLKVLWVSVKIRVAHKFYADQSRLEWALDNSVKNDIKAQEGYWQFFELGPDKTIGEYGTRVDTGLAVPHFIQETLARHASRVRSPRSATTSTRTGRGGASRRYGFVGAGFAGGSGVAAMTR